jgi:hypothetical protein
LSETIYTATDLTTGSLYYFKVQARNAEGLGEFSEILSVLAAERPQKPITPVTTWTRDYVTVTWSEPETNGGPITAYTIYVRLSTLTQYSEELVYCDGTDQTIIDT